MVEIKQALAALQASSKLAVYSEPSSTTIETQVDRRETQLPDQPSSSSVNPSGLPVILSATAPLETAPIEHSVISLSVDYSELPDTVVEIEVDHSELIEVSSSLPAEASEPQVDNSEPEVVTASSPPVATSEPAVGEAFAAEETPHLTRKQLGERLKTSHETIRKWEKSGKLAALGWEPVPGTGTGSGMERNPNNPRLYRPTTTPS